MKVLDYSWGRPGGEAIKAAGFDGVIRYVAYGGDGGKGLREEELADLRANGIDIGLVFESTAGRMFDGYPAGSDDAAQCVISGAAIGFPVDLPFYFACDVDIDPDMLALVDDYLAGAALVLGRARVGVYGEYDVIEHCHAVGSATWFWQTAAWSGGKRSDWNHIYQYSNGHVLNGAAVDYNEAVAEFGQWKAREEDDMTPEEVAAIAAGQFLSLLKQAIGVDVSTFSDYQSVDAIRAHLKAEAIGEHEHVGGTSGNVKR